MRVSCSFDTRAFLGRTALYPTKQRSGKQRQGADDRVCGEDVFEQLGKHIVYTRETVNPFCRSIEINRVSQRLVIFSRTVF